MNNSSRDETRSSVLAIRQGGVVHTAVFLLDFKNIESLGLQLVNILVEQIDSCIELERGKGTKFVLGINEVQGIKA